jgi:hypothetical protein
MTKGPENAVRPIRSARAVGTFARRGMCSETLFALINGAYGHPLRREEAASDPLVGGILLHGYQCGMVWGAALGAGAEAYRRFGAGAEAEARAVFASQRATEAFRARFDTTDCYDITGMNSQSSSWQMTRYFFLQAGSLRCFSKAAQYAKRALAAIEQALSAEHLDVPEYVEGCTARLARRLGASEAHVVMSAGLAGGVGLSGGGCGALGAAIWLLELRRMAASGKAQFTSPEARALVDMFLRASDFEFTCARIVGHPFDQLGDHADWVRDGGCASILDALSETVAGAC